MKVKSETDEVRPRFILEKVGKVASPFVLVSLLQYDSNHLTGSLSLRVFSELDSAIATASEISG